MSFAVVDTYNAVTADRCYAPGMPTTDALRILDESGGTHFDGYLVDSFIKMIGLYPPGTIIELVNGKVALVLALNHQYQYLPRIIQILDEAKSKMPEPVINLMDVEKERRDKDYLIKKAHVEEGRYSHA